ncbi:single-strand DNA-binding protein [Microbacterium testaceum]|uniref:single-stranded DNA-binding protein n=1 Tax=Microbacterium TaxID=33882 RepID=UPI00278B07D2|nr:MULTISPECIES: single-stranded DNA-binding protein [Microbacterium]MDQ1113907.1 single-strand DNA-binding protein [Microbacterium testaceum]MDR6098986.1 single-strand DNA-binding protein [Microbacterium sp. SORGH_AS_0454]
MSDHITLVGNIVGELEQRSTRGGGPIAAFRLAVGERKLDRERGEWVDGHTNYYNVSAFGDLGAHALHSLRKGQRVVLTGRLRLREWENEVKRGISADVVADAIGHDLRWGTTRFEKAAKAPGSSAATGHEAADPSAEEAWAIPGGADEGAPGVELVGAGAAPADGGSSSEAGSSGPF